jgi:hypothetical protein
MHANATVGAALRVAFEVCFILQEQNLTTCNICDFYAVFHGLTYFLQMASEYVDLKHNEIRACPLDV